MTQWDVERAPDGTVWVRPGASGRVWSGLGLLALGLWFAVWGSLMLRPGQSPLFFYVMAVVLIGSALWVFSAKRRNDFRWEWHAAAGRLERIEKQGRWGFTDASLVLRLLRGLDGNYVWQLSVQARETGWVIGQEVAADRQSWEDTEIGNLAQVLADATRFPLRGERGTTQ